LAVSTDHLTGLDSPAVPASDDAVMHFVALCPSAVLILDSAQIIVQVNDIGGELFGATSPHALIGRDFTDFMPPASRSELRRIYDELSAARTATLSGRLDVEKFGGVAVSINLAARRVEWRGQPAILCVVSDISDLTSPEPERVNGVSQQRLQEAIETMTEGFALFDADRRLVMFNENYRSQIWPRLAEFIKVGVVFEDIVHETLNRNVWEASGVDTETLLQQAIARHEDVPSLHEIQYPDGRCIQQSKRRTSEGGIVSVYSDITELKRREAESSETQDRHRRLLETLPDGVVIHSGGKFAYLNPAAIQLLGGKTHTDLIGRNSDDFVPPEDRAEILSRLEQVVQGQVSLPPEEQRRMRLDGRIINVEVRHTFIQWNAKPAVLTVLRDLTERKRAEYALQETERRYLTVAGNLPGAVYQRVMYPDGTIVYPYISRGVFETHGVDAEDVKRDGSLLTGRVHPDDRERFAEALKQSAESHTPFDMEVRNTKPDGQLVWVRSLARSRRREDGAIVWDGIFVDITARKQAEDRAAQAYRWLTEAIDSLSDGFALWDREDRLVLWNDKFISAHPQREVILKSGLEFSTLVEHAANNMRHHADEEQVASWVVERLQCHQEARGATEILTSSGRWMLLTERRTNEGYTVGVYTDIHERKRAENDLHASEERYRRLVQLSPDAILVDRDGVVVFANETAARMFGVGDPSDLLGTDSLDLAVEVDRVALASRRARLETAQLTSFEKYRYIRRDGTIGNCESAVSSITWEGEAAVLIVVRDIEDRLQAERQQALFGAVLHHAADSIELADNEFTLTYANPAFEKMSGYSSDEVVGEQPGDLFRPENADPDLYNTIEETVRSGKPWSGMLRARHKDGREYDQEASISPVFNESGMIENYVAIKRDVTRRVETQRALSEIEERYRKLLELTPDAVYVHVDAKIVLANQGAVEVFGARNEEEILGASIYDLMHSDVVPVAEDYQRRTGDTLRMEQMRRRLDGEEFRARVSITPLNWNGERGALVILTDITEQHRSQKNLIKAMETATIANKSKSEFLANMSHELRTPLNAIIGFSEIMQNEMFSEIGNDHYTEYARDIHESGMHLLYVINDILDLSKIEAGKLSASLSEVELSEAIETSVRLVRQNAADADVTVETRFVGPLPKIHVDQRMLKQMLMNLLSNAIKFTPGGTRVRVSARRADREFVEIAVVDAGVGISALDLPRVLEPFVQADHPVISQEAGTGLGLPLTKSLAELHGGTFRLWSRIGIGTCAVLRLPIMPPDEPGNPAADAD
jgi:PAS domain S-box-containing protein